ncbi:type IV toxin-antitoxin system AbiEi family antitoxin [Zobellella denitrificans]
MNGNATLLMLAMNNLPSHIQGESTFDPKPDGHPYSDAQVTLTVHGERYRFSVEIKHIHRKESLTALLDAARPDTLLVCNRLTVHLADFCSSNAINFIDEAGNARVSCNGLNLWIEGKNSSESHPVTQQQAKPGLGFMKLVFALLADEDVLRLPFRAIAEMANISLGMVSKGFKHLESEKLVSLGSTRRILDKEALYHIWIEHYRTVLRPKLGGIRLVAPGDWREIPLTPKDCWGGEVAADELTGYLQPYELQLFTFEPLQKRLALLKAKPDPAGRLWLVPAFWWKGLDININAKALLAVAELLASSDSRNKEVAELINEQYLHLKTLPETWV